MTCKEVYNYFSDYLDDEISAAVKKEIEDHLNICNRCSTVFNKVYNTKTYLRDLARIKAPDNFEIRLKERIALEFVQKGSFISNYLGSESFLRNKSTVGFSFAAILIAAFIIFIYNQQPTDYKLGISEPDLQKEVIDQNKMGIISNKNNFSVGSTGQNDSTKNVFDLKQKEQELEGRVKYIKK